MFKKVGRSTGVAGSQVLLQQQMIHHLLLHLILNLQAGPTLAAWGLALASNANGFALILPLTFEPAAIFFWAAICAGHMSSDRLSLLKAWSL